MGTPLPVIADCFRVAFIWKDAGTGQTAANIMHFQASASNAIDVKNDIDAAVTAAMWTVQEANAQVIRLDIIKLDGSSGTVSFPVSGAKWTGGGAASDFAPNVSNIVKMQTGLRGRSRRGRIYLPFVGESQTTAGSLGSAGVTAGQNAWDAFLAAMTVATTFPVVASYDRAHAGAGAHATLINKFVYEAQVGTQRRRQSRLR